MSKNYSNLNCFQSAQTWIQCYITRRFQTVNLPLSALNIWDKNIGRLVLDYIIPKTRFIWYQAQQDLTSNQSHTLQLYGKHNSNIQHLKKKQPHSIVCFEHFKYTNMISYMPTQDFWLDGGFSECRVLLLKHCGHQFMSDWFHPSLFPKVKYILYHDLPCDPYMVAAHFIKRNPNIIIECCSTC